MARTARLRVATVKAARRVSSPMASVSKNVKRDTLDTDVSKVSVNGIKIHFT